MKYWLMKSEPDTYSIDDLARQKITPWEGVRNYQARNFMTQSMSVGDLAFFYHSNAEPPAIVGLMRIASAPHPDESAFQKKSPYFDAKSKREKPTWFCVDCEFLEKFEEPISLSELRSDKKLASMLLLQRGQRLSILPLDPEHFKYLAQSLVKNSL
jgi:predicted RNA-binding protein with PUA-like domain